MLPETKGYLYVGTLDRPFSQIKVTKQLKEYDKKIIECTWENKAWKFMRERTDKSFPNAYKTAVGELLFLFRDEILPDFCAKIFFFFKDENDLESISECNNTTPNALNMQI
jgi:hypothetical protein